MFILICIVPGWQAASQRVADWVGWGSGVAQAAIDDRTRVARMRFRNKRGSRIHRWLLPRRAHAPMGLSIDAFAVEGSVDSTPQPGSCCMRQGRPSGHASQYPPPRPRSQPQTARVGLPHFLPFSTMPPISPTSPLCVFPEHLGHAAVVHDRASGAVAHLPASARLPDS